MATVILLHSALGLTRHVHDWADALRADGHAVETPDMFGGETFHDLDAAVAFVDSEGGPPTFVHAVASQIHDVDGPVVFAGFSLGGGVAEILALTRADASGLVVMHGTLSPAWFGIDSWSPGLRAQHHYMADDPWVEREEREAFAALAGDALEEFVYPGDGHLFAFEGWHEYDAEAAHRLYERFTEFVSELDG